MCMRVPGQGCVLLDSLPDLVSQMTWWSPHSVTCEALDFYKLVGLDQLDEAQPLGSEHPDVNSRWAWLHLWKHCRHPAGNRAGLFWILLRARLVNQASWPSLVLEVAGIGVATSLGGPALTPALPHTSHVTLGEPLKQLVFSDQGRDNNTSCLKVLCR